MATSINMSIYGLYQYDNTLFDNMVVPDTIDKDVLIANILLECAELTALYPSVPMIKEAIGYWSQARIHSWKKISGVLYEDYDPFINIKRDETRTIIQERDLNDEGKSTDSVNAWNSTESVDRTSTDVNNKQTGTVSTTEHFHVEGDSAITDAQDVAKKEIDLRTNYDLYNYIVNDFKNKFCLYIY